MDKQLEKEMGRDIKGMELTEQYEKDLLTIQRCINELERIRATRTLEYEKALRLR